MRSICLDYDDDNDDDDDTICVHNFPKLISYCHPFYCINFFFSHWQYFIAQKSSHHLLLHPKRTYNAGCFLWKRKTKKIKEKKSTRPFNFYFPDDKTNVNVINISTSSTYMSQCLCFCISCYSFFFLCYNICFSIFALLFNLLVWLLAK